MARPKHKLSEPPTPPARGVKAATFKLLLDTAMTIIQQSGHIPSVAEVAVRSNVSRATAYRYFTSRSALVTAVIDSSLPTSTIAGSTGSMCCAGCPGGRAGSRSRCAFAPTAGAAST